MPWSSRLNAEIYDRFVREHGVYRWLNEHLVEDAEIAAARRILDLGCGTGATVSACLARMTAGAEIVGVDAARAMVEVARANLHDSRASFEVAPAAELSGVTGLASDFDRVVSNAAFWQFRWPQRVFAGIAERTSPGALVAFNIPAERLVDEEASVHSFQIALDSEIRSEQTGGSTQDPAIDPGQLLSMAAESHLEPVARHRRVYQGTQGELVELMSIPAMIGRVAAGLDEERRDAVLERVRRRIDPDERVEVPWVTFVLRRR
ncbi:MAG: class I SAM-dependent methyltransferase [Acidobacteria bacterium]|nr:MAG: class I SAM-dependent methyltransferase [Acidobacteriota bacterium]REK08724.1 MAG: class I SAM-dependent methyltransferase [Acidobacteriota bacterium]